MNAPVPYPSTQLLLDAAYGGTTLPCHQCAANPSRRCDCPACLGSGFIRACARCFPSMQPPSRSDTPCVVCCGLHYTAANAPSREEDFFARPRLTAHQLRTAEV
jgi:hypothetical protein